MPHLFGTHHVVEDEDQGTPPPKKWHKDGRGETGVWRWMQLHVQEEVWSDTRGWMQRKQMHPWKRRTCWRGKKACIQPTMDTNEHPRRT